MNVAEIFDETVSRYDQVLEEAISLSGENRAFFARGRVAWLKRRLDELGQTPRKILDFGCGDGATTPLLLDVLGAESGLGIDVSPKSVDEARRRRADPRLKFELLERFRPLGDTDLAYANGVFHHIPRAERPAAVRTVHASLRSGGFFSFWENNAYHPATRWVMHRCPFDRDAVAIAPHEARTLLRDGGFEILRTDFRFVFPRLLGAFRRWENRLSPIPLGTQYQVLAFKHR